MWPFKSRPKEPKVSWRTQQFEEIKAFRDIGQTFNYLGRICIVTNLWEFHGINFGFYPRLVCDYADEHGNIHNISFAPWELPGLRAQNSESITQTGEGK